MEPTSSSVCFLQVSTPDMKAKDTSGKAPLSLDWGRAGRSEFPVVHTLIACGGDLGLSHHYSHSLLVCLVISWMRYL